MRNRSSLRSVECRGAVAVADNGAAIIPRDYEPFWIKFHYNSKHPLGLEVSGHALKGSNSFLTAVDRQDFIACALQGADVFTDHLSIAREGNYLNIVQQSTITLSVSVPIRAARKMAKVMKRMCANADMTVEHMITRELEALGMS